VQELLKRDKEMDKETENLKLKLELTTIIMGYENELLKCKREEISEFSKGCMERYYDLIKELKEAK
jgi:hypothetical protein